MVDNNCSNNDILNLWMLLNLISAGTESFSFNILQIIVYQRFLYILEKLEFIY